MSHPLDVIIVERLGSLKLLSIKDFKLEELYKKCGFKKAEDFVKQSEWSLKHDGKKYYVQVYGKTDGRANSENKYDFPPPIDNKLFYGSCAIIGQIKKDDGSRMYTNLSIPIWDKIYEKLFGGFEDLSSTAKEDEEEEDELENIPKERKTKEGYLKDGFVVDGSDDDDESEYVTSDGEDYIDEDIENDSNEIEVEDVGSELSEESYDYDDKNVSKQK
jgi:hypothetical protein